MLNSIIYDNCEKHKQLKENKDLNKKGKRVFVCP